MILAFLFLFGLILGSFLNVCIHRLPRHESVVTPRSHCPHCEQLIAAYDNIPLLSYLLLRGRCRHCRAHIAPVYFFVELVTGLLFLFLYARFGLTAEFAKSVVLGVLLVVLTVTDWQERLLPDRVTFPGMAGGFLLSLAVPIEDGTSLVLARLAGFEAAPVLLVSVADSLVGALVGGGLLYALGAVYFRLRHQEGMGFGDVKMMAMVGLFLGPRLALLTILLGSLGGSILGGLFIVVSRKSSAYELPFGSFLGVAALVAALWGKQILNWYLGFLA